MLPDAGGENLGARVTRGGAWVLGLRIVQRTVSLVRLVILARLLAPHDFGAMGIALLLLSTTDFFSRTGLEAALVQRREAPEPLLDAVWTLGLLRNLALTALLWLAADPAAVYFQHPGAANMLRAVSLVLVLRALGSARLVLLRRDLLFHRHVFHQFTGTACEFVVAVAAALIVRDAWALVYALIAGEMALLLSSYWAARHRPRLDFRFGRLKPLWRFGLGTSLSMALTFLLAQADDLLVARLLGPVSLAFYQMAYKLANLPATEFSAVLSQVMFPAYAKLHQQEAALARAYRQVLQVTAAVALPSGAWIWVLGPAAVPVVLGEQWAPAGFYVRVLAFYGAARALGATALPLLLAAGRVRQRVAIQAVHLMLMLALLYPAAKLYGLLGAACAVAGSGLIMNAVAVWAAARTVQAPLCSLLLPLIPSLLAGTLSAAALPALWAHFLAQLQVIPALLAVLLAGAALWAGLFSIFDALLGTRTLPLAWTHLKGLRTPK